MECSRSRIPFALLQSICTPEDSPRSATPTSTKALLTGQKQLPPSATSLATQLPTSTSTLPTSARLLPTATTQLDTPTTISSLSSSATTVTTDSSTETRSKQQLWRPFLDPAPTADVHQSSVTTTILSSVTVTTSSSTSSCRPTVLPTTRSSFPPPSSDVPLDLSTRSQPGSAKHSHSSQSASTRPPSSFKTEAVTFTTKPSTAPTSTTTRTATHNLSDYNRSLTTLRRSHLHALSSLQAQHSRDKQALQKSPWLIPSVNVYYQQQAVKLKQTYQQRVSALIHQRCTRDGVKSGLFTPQGSVILESWWNQHQENPFPDARTIDQLVYSTGLSNKQVRKWFTNRRHRYRKSSKPY